MEWQTVIDFCVYNEKVIGAVAALATATATFATAGALYFSARAAKASRDSADVALNTLEYSQRTSLREAFESRYSLLLEQHNQHLKNVCDYLDAQKSDAFRKSVENNKDVSIASKALMGHSIISPYMRILYHLLKHIDDNYYEKGLEGLVLVKKKKEYTSPLRSLIRNDVLYLIALNSIITKNISDGVSSDNGYSKYQKLLHDFDFFEHAIFYNWRESLPNGIPFEKIEIDFDNYYFNSILQKCSDSIYDNEYLTDKYIDRLYVMPPNVLFSLTYTYKNPAYRFVHELFDNIETKLTHVIDKELDNCQDNKQKSWASLRLLKGRYVGYNLLTENDRYPLKSFYDVKLMMKEYKHSNKKLDGVDFNNVTFYMNENSPFNVVPGNGVSDNIENYIYNQNLLELKNSPDRDEKITSLVSFAVKKVNEHRARLEQLRYDAP
ncbi:putative phage abortive infection protein [Yersinia enterocolitica]